MAIAGWLVLPARFVSEFVRQALGIIQYLHDSPVPSSLKSPNNAKKTPIFYSILSRFPQINTTI